MSEKINPLFQQVELDKNRHGLTMWINKKNELQKGRIQLKETPNGGNHYLTYEIYDENKQNIGTVGITFFNTLDQMRIGDVQLELQRQQYGRELYQLIVKMFPRFHLSSYVGASDLAKALWRKLAELDIAEQIGDEKWRIRSK